jgi:hypothetical protein
MCASAGSGASWFRSLFFEVSVVTMNAVPGNCGSVVFITEELNGEQTGGQDIIQYLGIFGGQ